MERKKMKTLSIAALIVSILPVATLIPVFLKITLSDGVRTAWEGANIVFVLLSCASCAGLDTLSDNLDYLQLLVSVLSKDFQPVTAMGVADVLNVFRTSQIDAICSDLYMRDGTGLELLEMVRKQNIRIPFMLMSGRSDIFLRWQKNRI